MKKYIILAFIFSLFIFSSCGKKDQKQATEKNFALPDSVTLIQANGIVLPQSGILDLSSETSGTITRINCVAGEKVKKGDTLIIINPEMAELNLQLQRNKVSAEENNIAVAQSELNKSLLELKQSEKDYEIAKRLYEKGAESRQEMENKQNAFAVKRANVDIAQQKLALAKANSIETRDGLGMAHKQLKDNFILAPSDGQVLDVFVDRGSAIQPYTKLLAFANDEPAIVQAEVDELYANKLKLNLPVEIRLIGYPQVIAKGEIYHMSNSLTDKSIFSDSGADKQDRQIRKIKVMIKNQSEAPLIGTKVNCVISL